MPFIGSKHNINLLTLQNPAGAMPFRFCFSTFWNFPFPAFFPHAFFCNRTFFFWISFPIQWYCDALSIGTLRWIMGFVSDTFFLPSENRSRLPLIFSRVLLYHHSTMNCCLNMGLGSFSHLNVYSWVWIRFDRMFVWNRFFFLDKVLLRFKLTLGQKFLSFCMIRSEPLDTCFDYFVVRCFPTIPAFATVISDIFVGKGSHDAQRNMRTRDLMRHSRRPHKRGFEPRRFRFCSQPSPILSGSHIFNPPPISNEPPPPYTLNLLSGKSVSIPGPKSTPPPILALPPTTCPPRSSVALRRTPMTPPVVRVR